MRRIYLAAVLVLLLPLSASADTWKKRVEGYLSNVEAQLEKLDKQVATAGTPRQRIRALDARLQELEKTRGIAPGQESVYGGLEEAKLLGSLTQALASLEQRAIVVAATAPPLGALGGISREKSPAASTPWAHLPRFEVERVVDGDTVVVTGTAGKATVRLIGVDTPETCHPQKAVEAYGRESSRFLKNLLRGEQVYVVMDQGVPSKDRNGRVLAYLYRAPDGLFVNLEIIRQGYGRVYSGQPFEHWEMFQNYQRRAREIGKGLWGAEEEEETCPPPPPVSTPRGAAGGVTTPPVVPGGGGAAPAPKADPMVYATKSGTKYHSASCGYLRKSSIPMRLSDAKRRGLSPCSRCGAPQ